LAKNCLCLTAKTIDRNLEILNKYRKFADIAELRVDCLDPDERLSIRRFPELAGIPVILTIRRDIDGGQFSGGEGARVKLLARGLAFANADTRLNFAYVDIEDDLKVPSLEEAARTFGTRIIRSYHDLEGETVDISAKIKSMQRTGDEIVKMAVAVKTTSDVLRIYRASRNCAVKNKIVICMGHLGIYSRILAEKFGSMITYSTALSENEAAGAAGQLDVRDLAEIYRIRKVSKKTRIYGVTGFPLKATISPWFFNSIFAMENIDAVYCPFPTDSIGSLLKLARELDVQGLSVTVPYKEEVLPELIKYSKSVLNVRACNTVFPVDGEWFGNNTDITGFSDSLLTFINKKNLKRQKITIVGAGGAARAVAAEVYRLGGKALILNRTANKAKSLALLYNFRWEVLDDRGIELISKFSDIIIQTTSVGMEGHEIADPLEMYSFTGKEAVMDLIYMPEKTLFLKRAEDAGCKILNGYDMVIRQACLQYQIFTGKELPQKLISRIKPLGENTWTKIRTV
jgi:3-dehydroquinate dehydratase/shikimate dehydrogenase